MNKLKDFASIRDAQAIGASDNMRVRVVECLVRIPSLKGFDDLLALGYRFPDPFAAVLTSLSPPQKFRFPA